MQKYLAIILIFISACSSDISSDSPEGYISLSPAVTEILFRLNADDKLVGVTDYCDYPDGVSEKESVGDMVNPSIEMIAYLNPETIFTAGEPQEKLAARLTDMGYNVVEAESRSIQEIYDNILKISEITGNPDEGERLVSEIKKEIAGIGKKLKNRDKKKVYVEISASPVMSPGKNSFLNDVIKKAGGVNVSAGFDRSYVLSGEEFIVEKNPEVILILSEAGRGRKERMKRVFGREVDAAEKGDIYYVEEKESIVRPGPRVSEGIRKMAEIIHSF